jgi:hypothetical protein
VKNLTYTLKNVKRQKKFSNKNLLTVHYEHTVSTEQDDDKLNISKFTVMALIKANMADILQSAQILLAYPHLLAVWLKSSEFSALHCCLMKGTYTRFMKP